MSTSREERYEQRKARVRELTMDRNANKKEILVTTSEACRIKYLFLTLRDTEDLYIYLEEKGIWELGGEAYIKELCHKIWREFSVNDINEIIAKVKRETYMPREILDMKHYLACTNGIYNLETKEFEITRPDHYVTSSINARYDPNADCPRIKQFFAEVLEPAEREVLLEAFAYTLHREYNIHKAFLLVGEGANGKSTALELLETFLSNKNVANIPLQSFETSQFMAAELYGKMANICSDLSNQALRNLGTLKMLTGNDTVKGERKRQDPFYFRNYAKMFYSMNKVPPIYNDNTISVWRRLVLLRFNRVFEEYEQDSNLLEKLTTEKELSGLLNLLLEKLAILLKRGSFKQLKSLEETQIEYKLLSNSAQAFCEVLILTEMGSFISTNELYENYREFCHELKLEIRTKQALTRTLPTLIKEASNVKRNKVRGWINIKVNWEKLKELKEIFIRDTGDTKDIKLSYRPHISEIYIHSTEFNVPRVPDVSILEEVKKIIKAEEPEPCHIDTILEVVQQKTKATLQQIQQVLDEMNNRGLIFQPSIKTYKVVS